MLDPEYIFHMAEGAEDISEQLHQAIINAIVGRLMARLAKGENYLTSTDRWNLKVLTDAGYLMEDIQREIAARTKLQMEEMRRIFEDAAIESFAWDMAVYQAAGLSPVPLAKSPQLIRLLQQDYIKTAGEWQNFTGTMADAAQQTFIRQCDEAYHLVTSGAMGYPQAVRRAIEAIAADGVTVQYTRWNERGQLEVYHTDTIETATLRAVRTGARQACDAISDARMDEMDWDIVLASAHLGARTGDGGEDYTNHYWWQGKFYSRSGKDKRFPPWSDVGEGDVQGFGGPNCRHSKGPGDGVHNPFEHFDSEENRKREMLDQRQRLLERRVRKTRREVMTLQEAIDKAPDDATRAELEAAHRKKALQLQRQEAEYDAFCKENDLRKLYDRLEVARYGPKQAKAAAEAAKSPANSADGDSNGFTKSKNIDIIQGERVPNSITAATPQQKLQGYLLNSNHPRGKDKARVFNSVLGYHYENWDKLSDKFFDGLQTSVVASVEKTRYGIKYKVPMRIVGERGKSMVVNTVWQLDNGSTITRLVTATFDKRTIRKEVNDAEIV